MGNVFSMALTKDQDIGGAIAEEIEDKEYSRVTASAIVKQDEEHDVIREREDRLKAREEEMNEFNNQLNIKRQQRKEILNRHRTEKEELERSLAIEKTTKLQLIEKNSFYRDLLIKNNIDIPDDSEIFDNDSSVITVITNMKEEFEKLKSCNNILRKDLADSNNALQKAFSDMSELSAQNIESMKQIKALKDVVSISKTMVNLREQQLTELKNKLSEIEQSLADREANMLSNELRQEYERQLNNIRTLRGLYEERARLAEVTRQGLVRDLDEQKTINEIEINKCKALTSRVEELESKITDLLAIIEDKNDQIVTHKDESQGFKSEMTTVNMLFSQVLLGYKTKHDLDKLIHRLEENHGLLTQMAEKENGSELSSALPKLLLELVSQVEENNGVIGDEIKSQVMCLPINNDSESTGDDENQNSVITTPKDIVENLPKVWKVLLELLSHQNTTADVNPEKITTCYKSVDTKSGPVLVPSVSQTYIRLKNLIVEKLTLVKEVNRMKQLNTHLETRLEEQERRLCLVTTELGKTWHVVGRLRRHHHQLHTHEKILKYELQQKRKLLNELKDELSYCREKWVEAREKNVQSERDWKKLRAEFSNRKDKVSSPINNSAESGYSDERPSDESSESNDESEYVPEPLGKCKKKFKKSFETILDSSTDCNMAAEREDPVSDMLDVAELPLDTIDSNPRTSDSYNSNNNLSKNELTCEETEDEVFDILEDPVDKNILVNVSCLNDNINHSERHEDITIVGTPISHESSSLQVETKRTENSEIKVVDAMAILESIRLQNERLAKKDKKLDMLEKDSAHLLKNVQSTASKSEQINNALDHLINRPTSSRDMELSNNKNFSNGITSNSQVVLATPETETKFSKNEYSFDHESQSEKNSQPSTSKCSVAYVDLEENKIEFESDDSLNDCCHKTDIKNIENIEFNIDLHKNTLQNRNLENHNEEITESFETGDINSEDRLSEKIDSALSKDELEKNMIYSSPESNENQAGLEVEETSSLNCNENELIPNNESSSIDDEISLKDDSEPSSSTEMDHEARFAARDIRLKRLEEQTKSLVSKMNNAATRHVRLHYKLEELHNIYGSENSRASTPDDSDNTKDEDTNDN